MIYCFDLDGTLCETKAGDYGAATPRLDRIHRVRALARAGHTIVVNTARGSMWHDFTARQLHEWAVPHHVLVCGAKPYADVYVDDRAQNAEAFFGRV